MKQLLSSAIAASLALAGSAPAWAAEADRSPPVTRILAVGTIRPGADLASVRAILPDEMRETLKLYLAGKIDQWFSLADEKGVVFLLNVTDRQEADSMLETLPLGRAHLMHFELTRLAPLQPAQLLLPTEPGTNR